MQHEKDIVIDADYADLSKARFLLKGNEFIGGEVILNGGKDQAVSANIPKGLVLTGDFDRFYLQDWQSAFADFSGDVSTSSDGAEVPEIPEWLSKVDLIIDEVVINPSNTWHNFKVDYNAAKNKSLFVSFMASIPFKTFPKTSSFISLETKSIITLANSTEPLWF